MYEFEREYYEKGMFLIAGIDEAGRGPLAGPVCAAAVILPTKEKIDGINDSKKLTPKAREEIFEIIKEIAVAWSVAFIEHAVIDDINIRNATRLAMENAVAGLSVKPEYLFIDGNMGINSEIPQKTIVKGDALSASVAAASIIAKVSRDALMEEYDRLYPEYGFAAHKGYGTKAHFEAIEKYGLCPIHRKTFYPCSTKV
ncbi:hypothetical protein FACS189490_06820 [Clostridia bacterium]|nr:hypothetical protein FACS189490_06820 [Clostridia bacterium]